MTSRTTYRRRSSDPQTLRERMEFRRDHKYARHRPLPDVPWRQHKHKTYLDDAERLYGRKETWCQVEDDTLREKLVTILQDFLRDTYAATNLERRDARKYQHMCELGAADFRAHVMAGAFAAPDMLRSWAETAVKCQKSSKAAMTQHTSTASTSAGVDLDVGADRTGEVNVGVSASPDDVERQEARRQRGQRASLENTVAIAGVSDADSQRSPQSGFPFLRQRAVDAENTLDPSLVDWTAKYFPDDTAAAFAQPPQLRQDGAAAGGESSERIASSEEAMGRAETASSVPGVPTHHARHRLQRSLRVHQDRRRATFDAEGLYFHVRRPSEDAERVAKPKAVRGSDLTRLSTEVVKVPWGVVATAKQQGYTADTLRAKERLIRLSRGEDPNSIP